MLGLASSPCLPPFLPFFFPCMAELILDESKPSLGSFGRGLMLTGRERGTALPLPPLPPRLEDNLSGGAGGLSSSLDILARSLMHSCGNRAPLTRAVWVDDAVVGLRVVATVPVEDGDGGEDEERKKEALTTAAMRRVLLCLSL